MLPPSCGIASVVWYGCDTDAGFYAAENLFSNKRDKNLLLVSLIVYHNARLLEQSGLGPTYAYMPWSLAEASFRSIMFPEQFSSYANFFFRIDEYTF